MSSTGEPGKPGKHGGPGWGGAGGEGGRGGVGEDPGGRGGPGGSGGAGGDLGGGLGGGLDYAVGRRRFRLLVMASLILASFSVLLSAWLFVRVTDTVDQVNVERSRNATEGCVRAAQQSTAIIDFIDGLGASPETLAAARVSFPSPSRAECELRSGRTVNP